MKVIMPVTMLAVGLLSSLLVARPAHADPHFVHGCYGHPRYYHGGCVSFGFGYGGYYVPPPVYMVPPPVVYYAPPVVAAPPVFVQQPVVVKPAPVATQPPISQPAPAFVETDRRYHRHGDNAGRLDWVEGLLDGRPTRIYYDDFGRIRKQKWVD